MSFSLSRDKSSETRASVIRQQFVWWVKVTRIEVTTQSNKANGHVWRAAVLAQKWEKWVDFDLLSLQWFSLLFHASLLLFLWFAQLHVLSAFVTKLFLLIKLCSSLTFAFAFKTLTNRKKNRNLSIILTNTLLVDWAVVGCRMLATHVVQFLGLRLVQKWMLMPSVNVTNQNTLKCFRFCRYLYRKCFAFRCFLLL